MEKQSLWEFAQARWHLLSLRQALLRFQNEFQQPACLLLALMWLAANGRQPSAALVKALCDETAGWERERLLPLRHLLREVDGAAEQAEFRQALLRAQLEGEKVLLARLETLADRLPSTPGRVSLDALILQALPEIGFCEGQTQLLATLVRAWEEHQKPGDD